MVVCELQVVLMQFIGAVDFYSHILLSVVESAAVSNHDVVLLPTALSIVSTVQSRPLGRRALSAKTLTLAGCISRTLSMPSIA